MIVLDDREVGMPEELSRFGVEVSVARLEYADCTFTGRGPHLATCLSNCKVSHEIDFGCERKKLGDLISSMRDRRLSGHQLRGMAMCYDYCLLFAEGAWRPGEHGEIEELRGRDWRPFYSSGNAASRTAISYAQLTAYLTTLELCGNIVVRRTRNARETAAQYAALWHWSNDKEWSAHRSHDQIYAPPPNVNGTSRGSRVGMQVMRDPTPVEEHASRLPGIADRKCVEMGKHFKSVRDMLNATRDRFEKVPGIGKKGSLAIMKHIDEPNPHYLTENGPETAA